MSSKVQSNKRALKEEKGDQIINSKEWKHIGYFGNYLIFGRDDKRCLVDPNTGKVSFEYEKTVGNAGHGAKRRRGNVKL